MKKMLLCAGILCSAGVLSAADFRIDVGGERDKVELEVKECSEKIRSSLRFCLRSPPRNCRSSEVFH